MVTKSLAVAVALLTLARFAFAGTYTNGSQINLVSVRGDIATASFVSEPAYGGASALLHPAYSTELRTGAKQGTDPSVWWKLQMPTVYKVQNYSFQFWGTAITCTDFTVQTSLDGTNWTTQATIASNAAQTVSGSFTSAVDAKYVKLDVTGYNNPSYGMILQKAKLTGPNNPEITAAISVAQSASNGGSAQLIDAWSAPRSAPGVLDDISTVLDQYWTNGNSQQQTNAAAASQTVLPQYQVPAGKSAQYIVTLNQAYALDAVGIATINDYRGARDMNVYLSPDASGSNWTLVRQVTDMPNPSVTHLPYYEYTISSGIQAKRVMFEIPRTWNESSGYNGNLFLTDAYVSELYVYAFVPEPASLSLLALGGLALLRRRK